jgi:hypothetical protein
MASLYNFKHILKLSLLLEVDSVNRSADESACRQLQRAFGINPAKVAWEPSKKIFDAGLSVSETDSHWSPFANQWVFDNYILPRVVDILSE